MADFTIEDLASVGLVRDQPGYKLHQSAWTQAENIRFADKRVKSLSGTSQAFGSLSGKPYFMLPAIGAGGTRFTIYGDLTKVYATDGTTHAEITGATTPAATAAKSWSGCTLGGIPVISEGTKAPQTWVPNLANDLADLTNWPANSAAKIIRAFGPYLMAFGPKKGGTTYPHGIWWSHPADPGAYPSSWDETDETKDAGFVELSDADAGTIQDAMMLRGQMYIYKENATWVMRLVGGKAIFSLDSFLERSGIFSTRCVGMTGDGRWHFVVTGDNVIVHNGSSTVLPLLDDRMRRTLFNAIDSTHYDNSFVFTNPNANEMWFCYPEVGSTQPTRALIWNYVQGKISEGQLGALSEATVSHVCAAIGDVSTAGLGIWSALSSTWDDLAYQWSTTARRQVLLGDIANTKIHVLDASMTRSGSAYTCTLQRTGIGLIGIRSQNSANMAGTLVTDFTKQKLVTRIWCDAMGTAFRVRLGAQSRVNGPVTWAGYKTFTPGTDLYLDFVVQGLAIAVEFSSITGSGWELLSYKLEQTVLGRF